MSEETESLKKALDTAADEFEVGLRVIDLDDDRRMKVRFLFGQALHKAVGAMTTAIQIIAEDMSEAEGLSPNAGLASYEITIQSYDARDAERLYREIEIMMSQESAAVGLLSMRKISPLRPHISGAGT